MSGETKEADKSAGPLVVQTAALERFRQLSTLTGHATVLNPDSLIQADADIRTARLAAGYSRSVFNRADTLLKSSVAMSKQAFETAQRQSETDAVQLKLLENRLQEVWGSGAPFITSHDREALVAALSEGQKIIVRADIAGASSGPIDDVKLSPLGGGPETHADAVWPAPSGNLSMPGVSYFAIAKSGPGLRAGDRATFSAVMKSNVGGVTIPRSAIVIAQGAAWCFVETSPQSYARKPVVLDAPVDDGYQVSDGFAEGERVVVRGAAALLAREASAAGTEKDAGHE